MDKRTNLLEALETYLRDLSRNKTTQKSAPLTLSWQQAGDEVILEDQTKTQFKPNTKQVESYVKEAGLGKANQVIVKRWNLDIKFNMMRVVTLNLYSTEFTLSAGTKKQDFDGPVLTFNIVPTIPFENLNPAVRGYLTRLAKQAHLVKIEHVPAEFPNLLRFIPNQKAPLSQLPDIQRRQGGRMEIEEKDPLQDLNPQGVDVLKKIQKAVSRQELFHFAESIQVRYPRGAKTILQTIQERRSVSPQGRK